MSVRFEMKYGCFVWYCIYGCFGSDYESEWEANQAFLAHDCRVPGAA